jgi:hypothetical protein
MDHERPVVRKGDVAFSALCPTQRTSSFRRSSVAIASRSTNFEPQNGQNVGRFSRIRAPHPPVPPQKNRTSKARPRESRRVISSNVLNASPPGQ